MARNESDREDLLREATALVPRVELEVSGEIEPVLIGIRSNGSLSVYFGADPMVQFDRGDRLRRACVDGLLYRTQGTTLARLERQRTAEETVLRRHDLTVDEMTELCGRLAARVLGLARTLEQGECRVRGRVPAADVAATEESTAGEQVPPEILHRMRELAESISCDGIRLAAALPTRRS